MSPFWWIWIVFLFMFLVAPIGYGWGYRGWGAPYPRYVQQRRALRASSLGSTYDHKAWGWSGDLVWFGFIIAAIWAFSTFLWLR